MTVVLVPLDAPLAALGALPSEVELVTGPREDVDVVVLDGALARRVPGLFAELPRLELVQTTSAGLDWILPTLPVGVTVCNASGVHDAPVAEWIAAVILASGRKLLGFADLQRSRVWDRNANDVTGDSEPILGRVDGLNGQTVLVIGFGSIGQALEARLRPFGVRVLGVARHARSGVHTPDEIDGLLPLADVVVLLVPLTDETEGIADAAFLARMKDGALLVNAARGQAVDTQALLAQLETGRLRAALDTTDPEPLTPDHPLWSAQNCLITPHVAGTVTGWRDRAYGFIGDQIRRFAAGEPLQNVRTDY